MISFGFPYVTSLFLFVNTKLLYTLLGSYKLKNTKKAKPEFSFFIKYFF